jgi:hypothetical protein
LSFARVFEQKCPVNFKAKWYFLGAFVTSVLAHADALDQWMTRTSPVPFAGADIIYAQGRFIAIGSGAKPGEPTLIVSSNGVDWTRIISSARFSLRSITYGSNGLFVAVGRTDIYDGAHMPGVITSTNGTNWIFFPTFGLQNGAKTNLEYVTYANGLFVAVGDFGVVATSYDGTNWATHTTPTSFPLTSVAYGNGLWLATGPKQPDGGPLPSSQGPQLISTDGTNWVQLNAAFNALQIIYANGLFVAIAGDTFTANLQPIRYSLDGTNWFNVSEPAIHVLRRVSYGGGIFVAVGNGVLKTSMDATNWVTRSNVTTNQLRSVAYGAHTVVAVGDVIVQSADTRPTVRIVQQPPIGGGLYAEYRLYVRGLSNAWYAIELSTDLISWQQRVAPSPASGGEDAFYNFSASGSRRFYRAKQEP